MILLGLLSKHYYRESVFEPPSGIHAWAQADRMALAQGFLHNGMDFFHPQTFSYLKFFGKTGVTPHDGITGVDFPIHPWLVAWGMKIAGRDSNAIYRLYTLSYSLIGLVFLFLFARRYSRFFLLPWLLVLFVFMSPVFTAYQDGFLQSIPSLANLFIALWCMGRYQDAPKSKWFYLTIGFFTLAALGRITFAIFLGAFLLVELISVIRKRKVMIAHWIAVPVSLGLLAFDYLYFYGYLVQAHGSIFLGEGRTPENMSEFGAQLQLAMDNWGWHYFTWYHYKLLWMIPIAGIASLILYRGKHPFPALLWMSLFSLPFVVFLTWFLSGQIDRHDYYFLDGIFPWICLTMLAFSLSIEVRANALKWLTGAVVVVCCLGFVEQNNKVQVERRQHVINYFANNEIIHLNQLGALLEKYPLPADAIPAVLPVGGPNIPMSRFNLFAIPVFRPNPEHIHKVMVWPFTHLCVEAHYLMPELLIQYPNFTNEMEFIGAEGGMFLFRKVANAKAADIRTFLQLHPSPQFAFSHTYDSAYVNEHPRLPAWDDSLHAGRVEEGKEFPVEVQLYPKDNKHPSWVQVKMRIPDQGFPKGLEAVTTVSEAGNNPPWNMRPFTFESAHVKPMDGWREYELWFWLPPSKSGNDRYLFYLNNPEKKTFLIDDFSLSVWQP